MPPDNYALLEPLIDPAALPPLIEPAKTALVIIDIQVDFVSPNGAAGKWGVDLSILDKPLDNVDAIIAAARAKGVTPRRRASGVEYHAVARRPGQVLRIARGVREDEFLYELCVELCALVGGSAIGI